MLAERFDRIDYAQARQDVEPFIHDSSCLLYTSKKVSDHHAVVPTRAAGETDLETLPVGEREILRLVSRQVLMAVSAPFVYLETEARLDCGGNAFAAKGKTILHICLLYTSRCV